MRSRCITCLLSIIVIVAVGLIGGCQKTASPDVTQPALYMTTNQRLIEGLSGKQIDLRDVDTVFWQVFSRLPDEVVVYPSENYYYFILYVNERQMWGNIRLAAGYREKGILSFAYFEFAEFNPIPDGGVTRSKLYTAQDGLKIEKIDDFTWKVIYKEKGVIFKLHKIPQVPPKLFKLANKEVFIERAFDESGYQFFLLFNEQKNYFLWVLNEEEGLVDILDPIADSKELVVGRRSGFIFWVDTANDSRKILVAVREHSLRRNDYFDGPFDQLADNYVDEVHVSEYMQKAYPSLKGRIDKYGYYTDTDRPLRVAITAYATYYTYSEIQQFLARAKASGDPYQYISQKGG